MTRCSTLATRATNDERRATIRVGHSPDADDAFMFYAIKHGKVATDGLKLADVVEDIESLNRRAMCSELEVTAMSVHAYAYCSDRYDIMTCGVSMGDGYGPVVVERDCHPRESGDPGSLPKPLDSRFRGNDKRIIAVPGRLTTAYLLLKLWNKNWDEIQFLPFDQIIPAVQNGQVDAGLLIHEGQIRFREFGLRKLIDLGAWWKSKTGLPVPLGIDAVRKDLGPRLKSKLTRILRESIQYALDHRKEAVRYALRFGRGMKRKTADRFVGMYVNDWTVDMGEKGRRAIRELLRRGRRAGIIP